MIIWRATETMQKVNGIIVDANYSRNKNSSFSFVLYVASLAARAPLICHWRKWFFQGIMMPIGLFEDEWMEWIGWKWWWSQTPQILPQHPHHHHYFWIFFLSTKKSSLRWRVKVFVKRWHFPCVAARVLFAICGVRLLLEK